MALHADLTREIDEGPAGPAVGAFFDVDGTLIAGFSAVAFLRDRLFNGRMSPRDVADTLLNGLRFQLGRVGFSGLIAATAAWLRGVPAQELEELADRIFAHGREHGIDLRQSYFYTDSHEDLPLLEIVGHARPTNPNRRLTAIAARRGWPVRRFTGRGWPGLAEVVRSSLAIASIIPAFAVG